jgi:hypothetical protein
MIALFCMNQTPAFFIFTAGLPARGAPDICKK